MSVQMDDTFAEALRDLLVQEVNGAKTRRSWIAGPRRWIAGAGAVLALAAAGGVAYATGVFGPLPGSRVVMDLSKPVTVTGTGTQAVPLGTPPAGADVINLSFRCLTTGDFTFADGAGVDCGTSDIANPVTYTLAITPGQDSTTITATPGTRWRLTATYASVATTAWGVNAAGQTYGVANQHGTPDLVAVFATNGRSGYVYSSQLNPPGPSSPAAALAQEAANTAGIYIPVYAQNGTTVIGQFEVTEPGADAG